MLGGWLVGPGFTIKQGVNTVEDKYKTLKRLLDSFTPEEKDAILEILQIALELVHSPLRV